MSEKPKWIKVSTGLFADDDRIKTIEKRPDRDSIMIIWFKLNIQAGRCNAGGTLQYTDVAPMDIDALSNLFERPEEEVKNAIKILMSWGLLDLDEEGFYFLPEWEQEQNEDALSRMREKNNDRQKKLRAKRKAEREAKKAAAIKPPVAPDPPKAAAAKVILPYDEIINYLNEAAGRKYTVTDKVKKWINGRFEDKFTLADFKRVIDVKTLEWKGTDRDMYLRPQTLFIPDNFQSYLNQPWPKGKGKVQADEANQPKGSGSSNWGVVE